ncbi:MAG: glycosyltransferase [Hassallia sp. WJT32-NPBG1]|jgi:glycosyltransferase involved in cell wall biosynthesis|nr:glycosyltransferase [Hassallia sp. WJT32-NPBG1]
MKTIQALARYLPDKCGGIQVNLSELVTKLQLQGIKIKIAAAKNGSKNEETYSYEGVEVYRYPVFPGAKRQPNHGQFPHSGFEYFANWLSNEKADIYHQHHFESTCGLPHLRLAKKLGLKTVVTIHYPLPICQRTTLMLNGQQPCDGKIDTVRCSYCTDNLTRRLPTSMVKLLAAMPMPIISRVKLPESAYIPSSADNGSIGAIVRPFVVPAFVAARSNSLLEMAKVADRIIAVCDWLYEALLINGIPKEKIVLSRCGISASAHDAIPQIKQYGEPLKVVFLGRWDRLKGLDILVEAVKNLPPEISIELAIHGIAQDEGYRQKIIELIGNDRRIRIAERLTREELPKKLANYDLLAVPSQWLETGPLVVLEAHALSLPVIGSNLGGISELVRHGIDGWLVNSHNDPKVWTEALALLASDTNLLNTLRQGIQPVRSVSMQAGDVASIYEKILM